MASARTEYLGLIVFPDITGVYQREVRIALVSGAHGNDSNMHLIDAAIKTLAEAMGALAPVASTGSYNDLTDKPDIPSAVPTATLERVGVVKPDGTTITVDADGVISAAIALATEECAGIVKPDGVSIVVENDGTIRARVTDAYTKAEVDRMMEDVSCLLMSSDDTTALYTAVNTLMGEDTPFSALGASIVSINAAADELLS